MKDGKIFLCGSYDLISRISDTVLNENNNLIIISNDSNSRTHFKDILVHDVSNQNECEDIILNNYKNVEDFLISSYWPWKFSNKIIKLFKKNSLNFHPSPLPKDRGWFPHVHQIRNNDISGVTLHVMDEKLDTGDIWVQKSIELPYPLTSGEAHNLLKNEIVDLFKRNWKNIYSSNISPKKQEGKGNFYSKDELETPEIIEIKKGSPEDSLLRIITSRNFNNRSFIKVRYDGSEDRYIHIHFSKEGNVDN